MIGAAARVGLKARNEWFAATASAIRIASIPISRNCPVGEVIAPQKRPGSAVGRAHERLAGGLR
jgi:hypothetical protein